MSKVTRQTSDSDSPFAVLFDGLMRLLFLAGLGLTLACLGFLLYTFFRFAGSDPAPELAKQAANNCDIFGKGLLGGIIALAISTAYLFWGEETLGPLQIIGASAFFFAPNYLPTVAGTTSLSNTATLALDAIRLAGLAGGVIAILAVVADVSSRVRMRAQEGAKAEQLKYGKGIKEERDIRNVFMGKCWQLPFCRKFVREKCPIYHARRTCWKERVGCMCEETVIRHAMEGRVVPRDALAAAKYIPRDSKLSPEMKAERCRQCVIYNEHQKHKYRLALPVVLASIGLVYVLFRTPLLDTMGLLLKRADSAIGTATFRANEGDAALRRADVAGLSIFKEVMLICVLLIVIAYLMKLIEYVFFKLKV